MGEQWRLGQVGRGPDRLDFEYNLTATSLTTVSGWVDVNALDLSSPVTTGTVGALDGNAAANRTPVAGTITGLSIAPGQTFWVRWADFNVTGADDGLGVDDFSLTPHTSNTISVADATVTEGDSGTTTAAFVVSLSNPAPAGGVTFDIATSDGTAQAPDDYAAAAVTGATIPQGGSTYTFDVAVSGDTTVEPDETFSADVSNVTGFDAGDTHAVGTIVNDDVPPPVPIHDIQGATHISLFAGQRPRVLGVVTTRSTNGFWMQDPTRDANPATSEGIFVFTGSAPTVAVGDSVRVQGTVQEFRPGGATNGNLTTTELSGSPSVTVLAAGNQLPDPVVIGNGGRIPPDAVIEDDASSGNVENSGVFDPDQDGLDFYESLEGMRVQLNDAVAVGPTATTFGETSVVGDDGATASVRTFRGGLLLRPNEGNPERVTLDNLLTPLPNVNVGDHYSASIVGVVDYNFGNPFIEVTTPDLTAVHDGVTRETTDPMAAGELAVSTFNFENLAPTNPQSKFDSLASLIVNNLRSPDLIAGEEVQDNNGATDNGVVDASQTLSRLVAAIEAAGGPTYAWREIDPVNDQDGGEPGGNIRQVFLFRADRGLSFVDRPGGDSTTPNAVTGSGSSTQLLYSPGRIAPADAAWNSSRKPLAAEFSYRGHKLFAIVNHFNSKGGDDPLRGRFQPPTRSSEVQRHQQAQLVADFVSDVSSADPAADVVVLGDLNDFEFSDTVGILEAAGLHDLMDTLPQNQRYSYDFEGNSQVLDHILLRGPLFARPLVFDPVHVNAEFFDQASDHDPSVVRVFLNDPPSVAAGGAVQRRGGLEHDADGLRGRPRRWDAVLCLGSRRQRHVRDRGARRELFSRRRPREPGRAGAGDRRRRLDVDRPGRGERPERRTDGRLQYSCDELRRVPVFALADGCPGSLGRRHGRRLQLRLRLRLGVWSLRFRRRRQLRDHRYRPPLGRRQGQGQGRRDQGVPRHRAGHRHVRQPLLACPKLRPPSGRRRRALRDPRRRRDGR
jgi:predicted extracellular nuclease